MNSANFLRITYSVTHRVLASCLAAFLVISSTPSCTLAQDEPPQTGEQRPLDTAPLGPRERAAESTLVKRVFLLPASPGDSAIQTARAFAEPLVPMPISAVAGENVALRNALMAFKTKADSEDISDLRGFLRTYPNSRWAASLQLNIGLMRMENGYISDALQMLKAAWDGSKNQNDRKADLVAQRAVSELLMLYARLGMKQDLERGFEEIGERPMLGSSAERIDGARQGLRAMNLAPKLSFKCGPYALNSILSLKNGKNVIDDRVKGFASSAEGTNMAQLLDWSAVLGLDMQVARRTAGAPVLVPSIMHWKANHFAAVVGEHEGKFHVQDPTFERMGNLWMTTGAIDSESDGFFLVSNGPLPRGWQPVSRSEAATIFGKGLSQSRDETKAPTEPKLCPGASGARPASSMGMAQCSIFAMQASVNIQDSPLSYHSPLGPDMMFGVNCNANEQGQPAIWAQSNLGPNWSGNWFSWVTVDGSRNATVHLRGGGLEKFKYTVPSNVTNPYPPSLTSQAVLSIASSGVFQRELPDGSIEVFALTDGTGNYLLTQVIDRLGNTATINHDPTTFRTTSVVDPNGKVTTFSYLSNTDTDPEYYTLSGIADPFGRTASFAYDSTKTFLLSITDAIGLVSSFTYNTTSGAVNTMKTPYGTTSFFPYTPSGGTYAPRGLRVKNPDGTMTVVENWLDHERNTYFWDREATSRYPDDAQKHIYSRCLTTRWLIDPANLNLTPVAGWVKPPLEAQVNFEYPNQGNATSVGSSNTPTVRKRDLTTNVPQVGTIAGAITASDIIYLQVLNQALTGGQTTVQYQVVENDTLSTIASGVASAVNASTALQAIGVSATSSGSQVRLTSTGSAPSSYFATLSVGATITMDIGSATTAPSSATVGGTVTAGDSIGVQVFDSGLSGGSVTASYTAKTGDNLSAIATGLAGKVNANAALQAIGVVASAAGAVVTLQSYSPNGTTYDDSLSGGATEILTINNSVAQIQVWRDEYNSRGYRTKSIDPVGRTFSYKYAGNDIDLLEIRETQGSDNFLLSKWQYNNQHVPTLAIDGSGQRTSIAYNAFGLPTSITNPISGTTTFAYNSDLTATIGGTVSNNKIATLNVFDVALPGGQQSPSYTAVGGDTTTTVATNLKNNINANANLQAIGVTATSSGAVITVKSVSYNTTTYSGSASNPMTMTVTPGPNGFLTAVRGPLQQQDISRTAWNLNGTPSSTTSSEGYVVAFQFDAMDRLTKAIYPDATTEQINYKNLDPVLFVDRLGRTMKQSFDSMDQLVSAVDPLGRETKYVWCACGSLASLTDAAIHTTSWDHDLQGRVLKKTFADSTDVDYEYESNTSRLQRQIDALNQKTNFTYNLDDTVAAISFTDAVTATPTVTYGYDSKFNRLASEENGWGRLDYTYNAYITDPFATATTGGGRLASIANNVIANSTITFSYDALGRATNRSINSSANSQTLTFDAISRVTAESNAMGSFAYSYIDNTSPNSKGSGRLSQVGYPNSLVSNFAWYGPSQDLRLKEVQSLNSTPNALAQFNYGYDPAGQIIRRVEQQPSRHINGAFDYDAGGQLTAARSGSGSQAPPYVDHSFFNYDSAANRTAAQLTTTQSAVIGGSKTTSDVVTITVFDPALSGGQQAVSHTVQSGDTLATIASNLAAAITANSSLQGIGVNAFASSTTLTLKSRSANLTTYTGSVSGGATETVTLGLNKNIENVTIGGTVHTGDVCTLVARDPALSGGQKSVAYTVVGGDTLTTIATALKNAVNGDGSLAAAGVSATSAARVIAVQSLSPNVTTYTSSVTGSGATTTMSLSVSLNGTETALIGGTKTTGDVLSITVLDAGLPGGVQTVSYTVGMGDTLTAITAGLATAVNNNSNLQGIGVSATSSSTKLQITSVSTNPTRYITAKSGGATETILWGLPANGTNTASIAGTKTTSDVLTITIYDAALSGGSKAINYTVLGSDTLNTIAAGLATNINGDASLAGIGVTAAAVTPISTVSVINLTSASNNATTFAASLSGGATETITLAPNVGASQSTFNNVNALTAVSAGGAVRFAGTTDRPVQPVNINSNPITMPSAMSFTGNPALSSGANTVTVAATAGGGSGTTTNTYKFQVKGSGSQSLTFDSNGNLTGDGTNTFSWDAKNRLVLITYPGSGNNSQLTYDALDRCVKIIEQTSGSTTSTKQFIWCGPMMCEERDGSGAVTKQFFEAGQRNGSTNYFFFRDHLSSVRTTANSSGVSQAEYAFAPYGAKQVLSESVAADFQFEGMYFHSRSGLNLTPNRFYSPALARWLNRDPVGESGGSNLYAFASNDPVNVGDPLGLTPITLCFGESSVDVDSDIFSGSDLSALLALGTDGSASQDSSCSSGFRAQYADPYANMTPERLAQMTPTERGNYRDYLWARRAEEVRRDPRASLWDISVADAYGRGWGTPAHYWGWWDPSDRSLWTSEFWELYHRFGVPPMVAQRRPRRFARFAVGRRTTPEGYFEHRVYIITYTRQDI